MISAVAEIYKLHPQTLRLYEREGLIRPARSSGNTRLYDAETVERLEIILNMREKMIEMEHQMAEFAQVVQQELSRLANRAEEPRPKTAIVRAVPRIVK